ncbi:hypothetical protein GH714_039463 [Hevea brasiliensis]|uniref:Protein kinase domain-containing protein n=1 Tax=Hevea brasiliensis TaxID=3981 RepID=A0A6A6KIA0_HEVBR|nr:hypothetical protein GH714_039463 [Hevea brasiliensis]
MAAFSPGIQSQMGTEEDHHKMKLDKKIVIFLIVACGILAIIVLFSLFGCCIYYWKLYQRKKNAQFSEVEKGVSATPFLGKFNSLTMVSNRGSVSLIDYKLLEKSTKNFGDDNLLGKGGFGRVYKALLEDDKHVAVKKLDCAGEDARREFENEVDLLSKIHHPNIISLLGYCVHEDMGFIVYELMQNGSLEDLLHAIGFGLAVADSSQNRNKLKLSGTVGYVAPEYMLDGELTEKSDVYAFGVVLLELLLGRRPVEKLAPAHCQSIVTWALPQLTSRASLPNIVDPVIKDTVDEKYLFQVAAVAVLCVQPEPTYRPLIIDVVHSLVPLIPVELGGTLRVATQAAQPGFHHNG